MAETTALNFGPQWLRESFAEPTGLNTTTPTSNQQAHPPRGEYGSAKPAQAKLAEFRYGREELLALFDSSNQRERDPPEEWVRNLGLWVTSFQRPVNLGAFEKEEREAWARGANSDTSMRIYRKNPEGIHVSGDVGFMIAGTRGAGSRGGLRGRGRGSPGAYERHRSVIDDPDLLDERAGDGGRGGHGVRGRGECKINAHHFGHLYN